MESLMLLIQINWRIVIISIGITAGVALLMGVIIMVIANVFTIKGQDPRIDDVKENLAGANCGGCGYAGCSDFAKALVEGKAEINDCGATNKDNKIKIASILGKQFSGEEMISVVACNGGINCADKFEYKGYCDCAYANMHSSGPKACNSGCIGLGNCASVCPVEAIKIIDEVAVVDRDRCIACGLCIKTCPKSIIKSIPKSAQVIVACCNECKGKEVMDICKVGCIACGLCARVCPHAAIHLENNLPIIDYGKCTGCGLCVDKCPKNVIHKVG
ncbi:MAG: RnfABCDGE type electron transport complex subunit B [Clostridia bacterium]|nr:RnfABCDGE type electron transport complex subunit B [Clostridia bacterium]